jgi:hypothetical protein
MYRHNPKIETAFGAHDNRSVVALLCIKKGSVLQEKANVFDD